MKFNFDIDVGAQLLSISDRDDHKYIAVEARRKRVLVKEKVK